LRIDTRGAVDELLVDGPRGRTSMDFVAVYSDRLGPD
jgi:hypothetical protein